MREVVIRKRFHLLSEAFYSWESANLIAENAAACRAKAFPIFSHANKLKAITTISEQVVRYGFEAFKKRIKDEGVPFIQRLPFMGPATSFHLAKNIGLDEVKPDRHLRRAAAASGYGTPRQMCEDIATIIGDRVAVVDLVIWRFATLHRDYLDLFIRASH